MSRLNTHKICNCGKQIQCERHPDTNQLALCSNNSLIEYFHISAKEVSYYNAAEGDCWRNEGGARAKAKRQFKAVCEEMDKRGIEKPTNGYLL